MHSPERPNTPPPRSRSRRCRLCQWLSRVDGRQPSIHAAAAGVPPPTRSKMFRSKVLVCLPRLCILNRRKRGEGLGPTASTPLKNFNPALMKTPTPSDMYCSHGMAQTQGTMKVQESNTGGAAGLGSTAGPQESGRTGRATGARGGKTAGMAGDGDRVEFSTLVSGLSRALIDSGASRSARVDALAALYRSGRYDSSAQVTARAMVSESLAGQAEEL